MIAATPQVRSVDSLVIGPVCVDRNIDADGHQERVVGGAAICAAAAAASLGHSVEAVLSLATGDDELLDSIPAPLARIVPVWGSATSSIQNVYSTKDQDRRVSTTLSQADALTASQIPSVSARIQHLAGLVVGDYEPGLIASLAERGPLAVDMQGFLRTVNPTSGLMELIDHHDDLHGVSILKVDAAEGEVMTGLTDRRLIGQALLERGVREVMVSHSSEILIITADGVHACPLRPRNLSGRTGRGDTVFSAYITERLDHSIDEALLNACATVSLKMETPGPLCATREAIMAYRQEFYGDYLAGLAHSSTEGGTHA